MLKYLSKRTPLKHLESSSQVLQVSKWLKNSANWHKTRAVNNFENRVSSLLCQHMKSQLSCWVIAETQILQGRTKFARCVFFLQNFVCIFCWWYICVVAIYFKLVTTGIITRNCQNFKPSCLFLNARFNKLKKK